jgi:excisionase family DNA binding protein
MRKLITPPRGPDYPAPRFFSVAETASILGVSPMTLYRAIRCGQFPAVQLMGRLIIPAKAIDDIVDAAVDAGALVDTEDWTLPGETPSAAGLLREHHESGRPRGREAVTGADSSAIANHRRR